MKVGDTLKCNESFCSYWDWNYFISKEYIIYRVDEERISVFRIDNGDGTEIQNSEFKFFDTKLDRVRKMIKQYESR